MRWCACCPTSGLLAILSSQRNTSGNGKCGGVGEVLDEGRTGDLLIVEEDEVVAGCRNLMGGIGRDDGKGGEKEDCCWESCLHGWLRSALFLDCLVWQAQLVMIRRAKASDAAELNPGRRHEVLLLLFVCALRLCALPLSTTVTRVFQRPPTSHPEMWL